MCCSYIRFFCVTWVKSVHICEATLTKRLIEFENTKAGSLTGTQRNSEPNANLKETAPTPGKFDKIGDAVDTSERSKDVPDTVDETDTLSDIDDYEVSCYLNNAEESRYKKIIWEQMNKEYMQEQAAKEAAAAAAPKLYTGTSEEIREAQALAAAAAEAVASKREKEKRKRALEAKNAKPAQTAAEAAGQLFTKKKLSSKINYDMLNTLFDDEPSPKKNHVDDGDAKGKELGKEQNETDDVGAVGEEEEDMEYNDADTGHEWDYDNEQAMNGYGYGYDDGAYDEEY